MAKITKRIDWRVEVYPLQHMGDDEMECRDIEKQIKRHVDGFNYTRIIADVEESCGFCGHNWERAIDDDGCPVCCNKAVDEWENSQ